MLRAVSYARAAGCDCQLLVAGEGEERTRLSELAKELDVEGDIVWLGAIAHDGIWSLMHAADVFMITNDVTNRCNPLYEAMCAGLPVVSVHDRSTGDLLEHGVNALLAEKEDAEALGTHLCRVCTDDRLASSMSDAQRSRAKQLWSWRERMAQEVGELEGIVRRRRVSLA